jgi:hypothetical protein
MHKSDALRILRNLDKIKHLASGGEFGFYIHDHYHVTRKINLPYLDKYDVINRPKPRYRLITKDVYELIED